MIKQKLVGEQTVMDEMTVVLDKYALDFIHYVDEDLKAYVELKYSEVAHAYNKVLKGLFTDTTVYPTRIQVYVNERNEENWGEKMD